MLDVDARKIMTTATVVPAGPPRSEGLSPAALQVAEQPIAAAYSPIVLAERCG